MSKEKRRVPKLRFPGFTEDWEQRKLLTVLNKIVDYRGRTPKKLGLDWSPTGHLALSALNVKMGYVDKTVDAHYGDDHLYSVWMKDNDLYKGQVLFTTEAPMGNVAQVPDDNKYILSQRTIAFVPDRRVISDNFLAVVLSASKCQKSLINRASGGTAKGVSQKTLSEISLDIPQSLSEQDKVSELIKKLSKIITLHQRKLDNLKLKKKALLQKLFPKNGERYPELRFPGFTDAWEQRKLEDVCNVYDGTHQTPRYTNSGVMFVSVEDIETLESNKYITEEDFKSEFKVFPEYGDILLTRIGDVGSANVILDEIKRAYYVSLALLKPKDINSLFLLALLSSSSVQSEIWRRTLHIAFPKKINKNEINKVIVNQPSIPEQKKIGKLFFSLDQTITLHQRKLDHLQLQKKALLQQMFV